MKRLKDGMIGFVIGSVLFSGIAYAASTLEVHFLPLKYYFNGIEKKLPQDHPGFIYKNRTYVPLRFIAEYSGKDVAWDGKTKSIYIGENSNTSKNQDKEHIYQSTHLQQEYGEWVYYIGDDLDKEHLYKIKKNGTEKTKVNNSRTIRFAIADDWIYTFEINERNAEEIAPNPQMGTKKYEMYRMKIDGTSREKIIEEENVFSFYIDDDMIYYIDISQHTANGVSVDGTNKKRIIDDVHRCIGIKDGWMYYTKHRGGIYRIELEGNGRTHQLLYESGISEVELEGEWIYYIDYSTREMYRLKIDGSEKHLVTDKKTYSKTVEGEWIYYIDTDLKYGNYGTVKGNLYKMKTDQTKEIVLSEGVGEYIVKEDWIYFRDKLYNSNLYKMKIDGSEKTLLYKDITDMISVGDGYALIYESGYDGRKMLIRTDIPYKEEIEYGEQDKKERIHRNQLELMEKIKTLKLRGHQLVKGRQFAETEEYIYYIEKKDDPGLYKYNNTNGEKIKLVDGIVTNLSIMYDWIYYTVNQSEDFPPMTELYKMKADGTSKTKIIDGYGIESFQIIGDVIVYVDKETNITKGYEGRRYIINKIYKTDINGTHKNLINNENLGEVTIDGEWLYYRDPGFGFMHKAKIDGTSKMKMTEKWVTNMELQGDWIYYNGSFDGKISRIGIDGSNKEAVSPDHFMTMLIDEDLIYYWNYAGLFKIKTDGTEHTEIYKGQEVSGIIGVSGDWIYYTDMSGRSKRMKKDGTMMQDI